VVERAARQLLEQLNQEGWTETILLALPRTVEQLDLSFSGQEVEIQVGVIRGIGKNRTFTIYWNPATDQGRIYRNHGYDHQS
jgi:hypothetical protein